MSARSRRFRSIAERSRGATHDGRAACGYQAALRLGQLWESIGCAHSGSTGDLVLAVKMRTMGVDCAFVSFSGSRCFS
jgi:hypothetical protein